MPIIVLNPWSNRSSSRDASFVPWSTELRQHILRRFPLDLGISPIAEDVQLEPKWKLTLVDDSPSDAGNKSCVAHFPPNAQRSTTPPVTSSKVYPTEDVNRELQSLVVTLDSNRRITPDEHWQDVRHIAFSSHTLASYGPGDVLTIYPKNFAEDVDHLISTMQWTDVADRPIYCSPVGSISASNFGPRALSASMLSHCTTLRSLLTDRLDFTAIPRRSFFATIAHFTQDQMHKDRLLEFTKPDYIDELYDYTTRPRRSILEVLQEFESVHIPWQWAMDVLPELRGRQFSIASGGCLKYDAVKGTRFELLVAIVKYKTVIKKIREGVCTRYLADLPPGTQIQVSLQRGGLGVLEKEAKRPVIMVGPGTGLAPLRSLIWEMFQWETQTNSQAIALDSDGSRPHEKPTAENVLFFGCRRSDADYFFKDEWVTLKRKMALQVFTAFSRDQGQKKYVQDVIKEQSELVFRLVHQSGGIVYVCGSSGKMPLGVRASLIEVFKFRGAMTQVGAEEYLKEMEKEGRYRQETW